MRSHNRSISEWNRPRVVTTSVHPENNELLALMNNLVFGNRTCHNIPLGLALAKLLGDAGEYAGYRLLAASYDWGTGVRRSADIAFEYWKKAAKLGDSYSQASLGYAYQHSIGTVKNLKMALYWYRKAAVRGNADAQYNLGQMYNEGEGVEKSPDIAVKWWSKAAIFGHPQAQCNLGVAYESGTGTTSDFTKARHWYLRAAKAGDKLARRNLVSLTSRVRKERARSLKKAKSTSYAV